MGVYVTCDLLAYVRIISFWSTGLGLRKVSICRDLMRLTNAGLLTQTLE